MPGQSDRPCVLVSDFDGTMTKTDFFELVRKDVPSVAPRDYWADYVEGRITHFEALAGIFAAIRADVPLMEDVVERMELDPALPAALHRLHENGWEVLVASAGCDWYIKKLLGGANIQVEVHANPGTFAPETGLTLTLPTHSPYFSPETGIDKVAIVRAALDRSACVAFAGDGRPDMAPALLVPPERRFARGWLAHNLQKQGHPFQPFESWTDIQEHLLDEKEA